MHDTSPSLDPYLTEDAWPRVVKRCPLHNKGCLCAACRYDGGIIEIDGAEALDALNDIQMDGRLDLTPMQMLSLLAIQVAPAIHALQRQADKAAELRTENTTLRVRLGTLEAELDLLKRRVPAMPATAYEWEQLDEKRARLVKS